MAKWEVQERRSRRGQSKDTGALFDFKDNQDVTSGLDEEPEGKNKTVSRATATGVWLAVRALTLYGTATPGQLRSATG